MKITEFTPSTRVMHAEKNPTVEIVAASLEAQTAIGKAGLDMYKSATDRYLEQCQKMGKLYMDSATKSLYWWLPVTEKNPPQKALDIIDKPRPMTHTGYETEIGPELTPAEYLRRAEIPIEWGDKTLTLRMANRNDAESLKTMYDNEKMLDKDDRVMRFFTPTNIPGKDFLDMSNLDATNQKYKYNTCVYGVFNEQNQPVAELTTVTDKTGHVDISYVVSKPYRHHGANKAAGRKPLIIDMISHAIEVMSLDPSAKSIHADVLTENKKSAQILAKVIGEYDDFSSPSVQYDQWEGTFTVDAKKISQE